MERIEKLRKAALRHRHCNDAFHYYFYKRYAANESKSEYQRYADAFAYAFSQLSPSIGEGELIVGQMNHELVGAAKEEWEQIYRPIAQERVERAGGGQDSHMAVDYELLLSCGVNGIAQSIDRHRVGCSPEQEEFYAAAKLCLEAILRHSLSYADHAESLAAKESDKVRKKELLEIARVCRNVPAKPAADFYEAVQSVHFVSYCLSLDPLRLGFLQFQLGRPDRYLAAYYKKERENRSLSRQRAQLLLDCLGIQINMRIPGGLSGGYMVGGRDETGALAENELTEMLMQVIDDIRLVYPSVGFCYTGDTDENCLDKACELLLRGRSHPAIFNDEVIVKGLQCYGVPEQEAHRYIHSTCVEITPIASSNAWVASPYTNVAGLLLKTMTREYESLEEHVLAFLELLDERIQRNFEEQKQRRRTRAENSLNPLLSCFVNDCLARGKDIEKGGARYNWIMPSFVGMANLVDSVYALKTLVYDQKKLSVLQFKEILDGNFQGHEALQAYLLNALPKYGNDVDEVDEWFGRFIRHIVAECKRYQGEHSCADLIPSVFCWIMHERLGSLTGATPDGRSAGFPLGDGSGPCQGRERKGPTASILSSTKWEHHEMIGGVAVNMKFSKSTLGEHSLPVLKSLIKTYMQRGGFEIQINVTDGAELKKAVRCPEEYRDLVVRVGGYSDYFTKLSPQMQQEILLRTEHSL